MKQLAQVLLVLTSSKFALTDLYLSKPQPTVTENEEGEVTKDHASCQRVAGS